MGHEDDGYLHATRHPWPCLLFLLPLLLAYEGGVLWLGAAQHDLLRNGADAWMRGALQAVGLHELCWPPPPRPRSSPWRTTSGRTARRLTATPSSSAPWPASTSRSSSSCAASASRSGRTPATTSSSASRSVSEAGERRQVRPPRRAC